jgi:hypothetical protein
VTWNSGQQAAYFNGSNAYIEIVVPANIDLTDGCIIEAKVYCDRTGYIWGNSILSGYYGAIGYNLCAPYFGYTVGPWVTKNYTLPLKSWTTVKGVRHEGRLKIYINDGLQVDDADPNPTPNNPIVRRKIQIGAFTDWGSDWYFKGYIKEIKLYTFQQ